MTKKVKKLAENASRANLLILHDPASINEALSIFDSIGNNKVAYSQFGTSIFFTSLNYNTTRQIIARFTEESFLYVLIYIANPIGGLVDAPGLSVADRQELITRIGMQQYA